LYYKKNIKNYLLLKNLCTWPGFFSYINKVSSILYFF
jgi:hypothetical protein